MSIIFKDRRIKAVEDQIDYIEQLIEDLGIDVIQQDITDLQTIATDHETRIDDLEATNPEALRGLSDVLFPTLGPTQNDKIIAYDSTSDKFILRSDNSGLPDADIDGTPYLREDGTWV